MTPLSKPKAPDDAANPAAPEVGEGRDARDAGNVDLEHVRQVATYQYFMNLAIVANVAGAALFFAVPDLQDILLILLLGLIAVSAGIAVLLARAMHGTAWAVVCAPLMLAPGVNVIVMLVLNRSAGRLVRDAGFPVGLLGPNPEDIR